MYACSCCKSAHSDIPLLSAWSPSESDEEILNDTILSELGETSVNWFDDLTKASECEEDTTLCASSPNVSVDWSPFPKGGMGLLYLDASTPKPLSYSHETSLKGLELSSQSLNECNWTSAMATPSQKCLEIVELNTENKENFPALEQRNEKKVIHRQLFSPAGSSSFNDSISLMSDDRPKGNLTIEIEKSIESERELSFVESDVSFCEQEASFLNSTCLEPGNKDLDPSVNVTSYLVCDNNIICDNSYILNESSTLTNLSFDHGSQKPCPELSVVVKRKKNVVFGSFSPVPAQGIIDQCSTDNLMKDGSFCLAPQRDLDFSNTSCKSDEKSINVNRGGVSKAENNMKQNNVNNSSHIEKVLSIVFVSQDSVGDKGLEVNRDAANSKQDAHDSLDFFMDASFDDEFISDETRKRQSFDLTPQAKRQKLDDASKDNIENTSLLDNDTDYWSTPKNEKNHCSVDRRLNFSACKKLDDAGNYKQKAVAVSILKNPLTPKSTCKKKVHFSLDVSHKQAVKKSTVVTESSLVDGKKLQALTAHTVESICHPDNTEELGVYFFKNTDYYGCEDHSVTGDHGNIKFEKDLQNINRVSEKGLNISNFSNIHQNISHVSGCHTNINEISHNVSAVSENQKDIFKFSASYTSLSQQNKSLLINKEICYRKDSDALKPVYVDSDLLDYNFDSSFEASPTFSSQVGQVKQEESFTNMNHQKENPIYDAVQPDGIKCLESCNIIKHQNNESLTCDDEVQIKLEQNMSVSDHHVVVFDSDDDNNICAAVNKIESDLDLQEKSHSKDRTDSVICSTTESFNSFVKSDELVATAKPDQDLHYSHSETKPDIKSSVESTLKDNTCDSSLTACPISITPSISKTLPHCNFSEGSSISLTSVSKRPKKFRYPTAEQIASFKPEIPIAVDFPTMLCHAVDEVKPTLGQNEPSLISSEVQQTEITEQDHHLQLSKCAINEDDNIMFTSSNVLDFVTFSEVFKEVLTESKPEVTLTDSTSATNMLPHEMCTSSSPTAQTMTAHNNTNDDIKSDDMVGQSSHLVISDSQMTMKTLDDVMLTFIGSKADECLSSELPPQAVSESHSVNDEEILLNSEIWAASEFTQFVDDLPLEVKVKNVDVVHSNDHQSLTNTTSKPNNKESPHINQTSKNLILDNEIHKKLISSKCDSSLQGISHFSYAKYVEHLPCLESALELNQEKLINSGFQGFTTASGHHLSNSLVPSVSKCEGSIEDQLECLLTSRKENLNCKQKLSELNTKMNLHVKQKTVIRENQSIDNRTDEGYQKFVAKKISAGFTAAKNINKHLTNMSCERRKKEALHEATLINETVESKVASVMPSHSTNRMLVNSDKLRIHEECPLTTNLSFSMPGFSTAGGKHITLSESAKAKAAKLFDAVTLETDGLVSCGIEEALDIKLGNVAQDKTGFLAVNLPSEKNISFDKRHNGFRPFKPPSKKNCTMKTNVGSTPQQLKQTSLSQDQWEDDSDMKEIINSEEIHIAGRSVTSTVLLESNQPISLLTFSATLGDHFVKPATAGHPLSVSFSTGSGKELLISEKAFQAAENFMKDFSVDITTLPSPELITDSAVDVLTTHHDVQNKITIEESISVNLHQDDCSMNTNILCMSSDNSEVKHSVPQQLHLSKTHCGVLNTDIRGKQISKNSLHAQASVNNDIKEIFVSESNNTPESEKQHWCTAEEISFDSDINFETLVTGVSEYDSLSKSSELVSSGLEIQIPGRDKEDNLKIAHLKCKENISVFVKDTVQAGDKVLSPLTAETNPGAKEYPVTLSTASSTTADVFEKSLQHEKHFLDEEGQNRKMSGELKYLNSPLVNKSETLVTPVSATFDESHGMPVKTGRLGVDTSMQRACSTDTHCHDKPTLKTCGFSTASGFGVKVTEKSLRHAHILFNDCDDATSTITSTTKSGLTHTDDLQRHANNKSSLHLNDGNSNTCSFPGFTTASGNTVTVSEKSWQHARSFLGECDQNMVQQDDSNNTKFYTESQQRKCTPKQPSFDKLDISLASGTSLQSSGHLYKKCVDSLTPITESCHISRGFSTASGNKVNVSKKALEHAHNFLKDSVIDSDIDNDTLTENTQKRHVKLTSNIHEIGGFSTASGNKVNVSKKALEHAQNFLKDSVIDSDIDIDTLTDQSQKRHPKLTSNIHEMGGFSTAAGNKVSVSKKALEHAQNFLKDSVIDSDIDNDTLTENTQKRHVKLTSNIHEIGGFLTASGNKVNVSKKALDHAQNFLKDSQIGSVSVPLTDNLQESNVNIISDKHEMRSFATASGNKVNVSKKALEHAQSFLQDPTTTSEIVAPADNNLHSDIKINFNNFGMGGFTTASGSKVNVSEKALSHAKNILKDSTSETGRTTGETKNKTSQEMVQTGNLADIKIPMISSDSNTATPVTYRPMTIDNAVTVPKRNALTPVTSRCEEFHYDRPVTRSGKRLHPVKPRSLTHELSILPAASVNCSSKSSFKPPYKKVKLSSEKDQEVPSAPLSGNKKSQIAKSSFFPPAFKSPVCTADTKMPSNIKTEVSETLVRQSCSTETEADVTNNTFNIFTTLNTGNDIKTKNAVSMDLEDDVENQLLCQDYEVCSQTTPVDNCRPSEMKSQSSEGLIVSKKCSSSSLTRSTNYQNDQVVLQGFETFKTLSEELEEQRMRQDKIIRSKKRTRVRPRCGRWMEARKQKGALQKFSETDMEPSSGLTKEELVSLGVSPSTINVTSLNAMEFRFDVRCFYPALDTSVLLGDGALMVTDRCGFAGVEEFYRAFQTLDGVDPSLLDDVWLRNHYRWIVWKLAAYEVCFPHHFAGRSLTPDNVMLQLKYRYDREIDACHRSALKKILERDETSCKRMVLCVASVVHSSDGQPNVEVTDGWYSVRAQLDHRLTDLISRKRIVPGDKIITSGAELVGSQEACSPLEIKEGLALKLHGNSTRPAPWHSRLGFCFPPSPLCVPIRSLCPEGGHLGCVDVVISRIYPVVYMEKLKDGSCVFRTREEEDKARQKYEDKRQADLEKIYSSLKLEKKENLRGKNQNLKKLNKTDIERLWSGKEIADALDKALNPEEIQLLLSSSQINRLLEHRQGEMDRNQQEAKKRLLDAMSESEERNVTPLLKVKGSGLCGIDVDDSVSCLVTVWRPGPEWLNMKEGKRYKIYNLSVSHVRGRSGPCKVSLTASRQTRLKLCRLCDNLLDMVYEPRQVWTVSDLTSRIPIGDEFDFLGVVLHIIPPSRMSQPTVLYAGDKNNEFLCIKIWSNPQIISLKFGDIFVAHSLFLNKLSGNKSSHSSILTADARDLTTITTNGNSSRYSEIFSQMQVFCKTSNAVSHLKSKLDTCLSSNQNVPAAKASTYFSKYPEDFPLDIVDKIFSPMSQQVDSSSKSALMSLATPEINRKYNGLEQHQTIFSNKLNQASCVASDITLQKTYITTTDEKDECKIIDRRKQMLRDKMAKLLSYDQPAPLDFIPLGGSPACKGEFKSPLSNRK